MPDLQANCSDPALWEPFIKKLMKSAQTVTLLWPSCLPVYSKDFIFLWASMDMLMNYLLEPEDMMDLCNAIGEYRFQYMKLIVDISNRM